ncbi:Zn-dependent oxidoreductase [Bacterioplanes sanyensis]|uniref:alcohol dehydrogenase catalytic domain-containing protein n=1 Tax=Bacterioplanes sanyensis TaxID=1249553 RepID=UPI0016741523|nr:zinc-binding dehydrogenase [Bacterioplanes sanyensis]GGY35599.1 Zn-dependent oxidoreductase [Bacterioplanes sanyensis]
MTDTPTTMAAMLLQGHGDIEQLIYRTDVPTPSPNTGEVLVKVSATAKNNTDRKVREGLYPTQDNSTVTSFQMTESPTLSFPRIQGADVVGRVVAVGKGVSTERIGQRGLLDFNIYADQRDDINLTPDYFGHGRDGGFAEYIAVPADQFYDMSDCPYSDAELAALGMCSYQTAYHMLTSARVKAGEHILISGASGGVGTALIQLCRLLGATPYAISSPGKSEGLKALGAASVIDRTQVSDWRSAVAKATGGVIIDAVMDLAGGSMINPLLDVMTEHMSQRKDYPRLSIAGASAGNVTDILWTKIYLYQIQLFGVSHGTRAEARQLMHWIRQGDLKPVLHGTFPLSELHAAERYFASGRAQDYLGKLVIVPDSEWQQHGAPYAIQGVSA